MAAFVWGTLFFMALLGYAVYRFFFKRIIYIRKNILIFSDKILKIDDLHQQIAKANSEGKKEEKFKLFQECIALHEEQQEVLNPTIANFLACVTPLHKNYYMMAKSFKDNVRDMYLDHAEMLDISNMPQIYHEGVHTAIKLKNAGILNVGDEFVWWRPELAPDCNLGTMALAKWLNRLDENGQQQYQEALDAVSHVSESDLPLFQPLDPLNGFMTYFVLHNKAITINSAIKTCLQLIAEGTAPEKSYDLEQDLTYYAQTLADLLMLQRRTFWAIGWLDLMPTQEEIEAERLNGEDSFKPSHDDKEFVA